jgi:hypothetical protein
VLDVPISFFFDDMPPSIGSTPGLSNATLGGRRGGGFSDTQDNFADDMLNRRETVDLVRAYYRISEPSVRKSVFEIIKKLTPDTME